MGDMSPVKDLGSGGGRRVAVHRSTRHVRLYGRHLAPRAALVPRLHETFSEKDADLNANIVRTLVEDLQGGPLRTDAAGRTDH